MNSETKKGLGLICFSEQLVETILTLTRENSLLAIRKFSMLVLGLRMVVFLLFPSQEMLGQLESLKLENRHLSEMVMKLELGLHEVHI